MKLLLMIFCQAPFSSELKTENLTDMLLSLYPTKVELDTKRKTKFPIYFPNICVLLGRIGPAAESMHCVGVAISAWPDQSCPKNQDKWIANQKQTHLFLGETFQWNV